MSGIQLYQPGGAGVLNAAGAQHPSPVTIEVGLICQLSPVGITSTTYRWELTKPEGSNSVLSSRTSAGPSFMPDVENGSYSISLFDIDENEYILDIVTPTSGSGGGGGGGSVVTTVTDYDSARDSATFTGTPPASFIVQCREDVDDGGGGLFAYDPDDESTADNDGTVLVSSSGARFKRIFSGPVHTKWFGAREDSPDNTDALQAAFDASNDVYIDEGTFEFSSRLNVTGAKRLDGDGKNAILSYTGSGTAIRYENPTGTQTAQMEWRNFALSGGSSSKIGVELVNANGVTIYNLDIDGNNSGFDEAGIRITCAFGAFNSANVAIQGGTRVHECSGDGIQAYYPPDMPVTFNASTNVVNCTGHGKLEGDLVLFGTDGSLSGTGITGGVQDFYFVRNPTSNTFQVSLTSGGSVVDILGTGTGNHKVVGPGAPASGITICECTIDQCENGVVTDAGTVGTAGGFSIVSTTLQSNRNSQICGSFLRSRIVDCHMEQGGSALTGGAHILVGEDQQVYSLVIQGNLISGTNGGQEYSIDVNPSGATRRNVSIVGNFLNRAEQYNIRVGGIQGVEVGLNYYGNYELGTVTFANCTGVRFHDADYDMGTMPVRTVVTDNYTAGQLDELIQVNGSGKTITLPRADSFSLYGGKRYTIYNLLDTTTTIARSASDTIRGATSYTLTGQYASVTFVAVTLDNGTTFHWAPLASHGVNDVTGTVAVARVMRGMPFIYEADADIDEYGRVVINTTAGTIVKIPVDVPHGATISEITLQVIAGSNVGLPAVMPGFRLRTLTVATNGTAATSIESDGSINVGAYNAQHTIDMTGLSEVVDNIAKRYTIEFFSESGANAAAGFTLIAAIVYFTAASALDRGAA